MEDALALNNFTVTGYLCKGLNPCSNGRCTRTPRILFINHKQGGVLILVLMEDALAPFKNKNYERNEQLS